MLRLEVLQELRLLLCLGLPSGLDFGLVLDSERLLAVGLVLRNHLRMGRFLRLGLLRLGPGVDRGRGGCHPRLDGLRGRHHLRGQHGGGLLRGPLRGQLGGHRQVARGHRGRQRQGGRERLQSMAKRRPRLLHLRLLRLRLMRLERRKCHGRPALHALGARDPGSEDSAARGYELLDGHWGDAEVAFDSQPNRRHLGEQLQALFLDDTHEFEKQLLAQPVMGEVQLVRQARGMQCLQPSDHVAERLVRQATTEGLYPLR
mmetsp:Transcript_94523/g.267005  ORF Transcript_94523/g.267005 Transcript_94523/m.267005 type:complete len:259 (+) Transcript_94523:766-1542(+)